jgi:predicted GNAT family N-acyltransferase
MSRNFLITLKKEFKYIDTNHVLYEKAVALRIEAFFDGLDNPLALINDEFESKGIHLICLTDNNVIGTGRLNFIENESVISQMAIDIDYQRNAVGSEILKKLIAYCKKNKVSKINLSARESALDFYKKYSFLPVGEKYPSKKTTIIHQKMELLLK